MDEREFQELMRYQSMLSRQVVQEARTDKKIALITIFNQLSSNGRRKVQTAALLHAAEEHGLLESEIYDLVDELQRDHVFIEKAGYVSKQ
jgi:hypothetical protein